jgi:putative FmdB family regulatory protein
MPIYEFVCPHCGYEEDKLVSMGTDSILCTSCGETMLKMMSAPHFNLKGFTAENSYGLKNKKEKKK